MYIRCIILFFTTNHLSGSMADILLIQQIVWGQGNCGTFHAVLNKIILRTCFKLNKQLITFPGLGVNLVCLFNSKVFYLMKVCLISVKELQCRYSGLQMLQFSELEGGAGIWIRHRVGVIFEKNWVNGWSEFRIVYQSAVCQTEIR